MIYSIKDYLRIVRKVATIKLLPKGPANRRGSLVAQLLPSAIQNFVQGILFGPGDHSRVLQPSQL